MWNGFTSGASKVVNAFSKGVEIARNTASDAWDTAKDLASSAAGAVQGAKFSAITTAAKLWQHRGEYWDAAKQAAGRWADAADEFVKGWGPTIKAVAAGVVVGAVVFVGCEIITGGIWSVGCLALAGAAGGAVTGAMLCPEGQSKWTCAGIGALSGAAAGATFGAASALGAGAITAGALSGGVGAFVGDGATQLATTGTIDPAQLAKSTATGAVTGGLLGAAPGAAGAIGRGMAAPAKTAATSARGATTRLVNHLRNFDWSSDLGAMRIPGRIPRLSSTSEDLYHFGNASSPRGARPSDFGVTSGDDTVGPYAPVSPRENVGGVSTFIDPHETGLSGHYYRLPSGTALPEGLGIHADGSDVNGLAPAGHRTIYPTRSMTLTNFQDLVMTLPWEWAGRIR